MNDDKFVGLLCLTALGLAYLALSAFSTKPIPTDVVMALAAGIAGLVTGKGKG